MYNTTPKAPRKLNFVGVKMSEIELAMLDSMCTQFKCTRSNLLQSLVKDAASKVLSKSPECISKGEKTNANYNQSTSNNVNRSWHES